MSLLIKSANSAFNQAKYKEALELYKQAQRAYPDISHLLELNISICRQKMTNRSSNISISMTTISERLHLIDPVVKSLLNQSLLPSEIIINVSESPYLLDKGVNKDDPRLKALESLPKVRINWVDNTGPHRKIMPFVADFFASGSLEHRTFITVDDDTLYPEYFIRTLVDEYLEHDCVIAFRGRKVTFEKGKVASYENWLLGSTDLNMANLPTGKDGVIYSTKFFTKEFLNLEKALELTPTADDLWIKWNCALNGVKAKILNPEAATSDYKSFPVVDYSSEYRDVSLFKAHNSNGSGGKNDKSVLALEAYFKKIYGYNLADACSLEGA